MRCSSRITRTQSSDASETQLDTLGGVHALIIRRSKAFSSPCSVMPTNAPTRDYIKHQHSNPLTVSAPVPYRFFSRQHSTHCECYWNLSDHYTLFAFNTQYCCWSLFLWFGWSTKYSIFSQLFFVCLRSTWLLLSGILFDKDAVQSQAVVRYEIERFNNGTSFRLDKYEKLVEVEESVELAKAGESRD